jgi:hypothetical protein
MGHNGRFDAGDVSDSARNKSASNADAELAHDQLVPDKSLLRVEFSPGLSDKSLLLFCGKLR